MDEDQTRELAGALADAADRATRDLLEGDIGEEDDLASQLCGRMKSAVENLNLDGVKLRARHLKSRGPRAEEPHIGADLVIVLDRSEPADRVIKGLLLQAKKTADGTLTRSEFNRLRDQCRSMLRHSAASFAIDFQTSGIFSVGASEVLSASQKVRSLHSLPGYFFDILMFDFVTCWVGDHQLRATSISSLEERRQRAEARQALLIQSWSR